jgi:prepilin-type N-terminal cleavage/methylation domain-containing protein
MIKKPKTYSATNRAFTLIELMVVMAIVALLMGLVGPLTIKGYEKIKAKEELMSLKNWIKGNSYRSFATAKQGEMLLSNQNISLTFANNDLFSSIDNSQREVIKKIIASRNFKYLTFSPQKISVNTFGLITPSNITVQLNGKSINIGISESTLIIGPLNNEKSID